MLRKARTLLLAVLALALVAATDARADGLPVADLDTTRTGISSPNGSSHYYAVSSRGRTELLSVTPERERGLRRLALDGILAVPGVAFDGTTSGLSADGNTLVLIEPRRGFPRRRTRLVVVDTERWEVFDRIDLRGDFSFDAISPDGSTIYFIHYLDRRDPTKYEVRAYDTVPGRLRPEPVIDARTAPTVMRGFPITRETSPDGALEYTLYDGGGGTPFVHALDTTDATAFCIDLPQLEDSPDLFTAGLDVAPDGGSIAVLDGSKGPPVAVIETGTWSVSDPAAAEPSGAEDDGIPSWWAVAAIAMLIAGLIGVLGRRRSAALPADPMPELPGDEPGTDPAADGEPSSGERQSVG